MTFLNPLLLFGLFAAAIPIILHLLNLRKLKTVEFSTLQFLKELQKTKMRRVMLKQWLLLALRTLLIIAVVMAFSRPALRGSLAGFGAVPTQARTTMVLLLDDSPSMSVRNERGQLFAQAQEAARRILDLVKDGDEAFLIPLSAIHHAATFTPSHDIAGLKNLLARQSPSFEHVRYRDAFGLAAKILSESHNVNKELYLITDGQNTHFALAAADSADVFDDRTKLFLVDVRGGRSTPSNVGIVGVEVLSTIIARNKPVLVRAHLYNAGAAALQNVVLSAYLDGERVQQQSLALPAHGAASAVLTITPKRSGILAGYLQLEDDALDADNTRWFVLNVPQSIAVLCACNSADDTRMPALALSLDRDSASGGLFSLDIVGEEQLASRDLRRYDALLLAGVRDFSSGEAERIEQFVAGGGGVIIFPGSSSAITNYNSELFTRLQIPPARAATPRTAEATDESSGFLSFARVEFEHPLFAGLFDLPQGRLRSPNIESPRVYTTIVPSVGTTGTALITLSDGTPFLTEYRHGAGKVMLFSVEASTRWSDFPVKPIFVPLLYRLGQYLAQSAPPPDVTVGEEFRAPLRLKQRGETQALVLHSPSGIDERIVPAPNPASGNAVFSSASIVEPGVYELREAAHSLHAEPILAFAANIAAEETDLQHATARDIERFLGTIGINEEQVRVLAPDADLERSVIESRYGVELWKLFVVLALACAFGEMIIARSQAETSKE